MKWKHIIPFSLIVLCLGYLMGVFLPPWIISRPQVDSSSIPIWEYHANVISFFGALGTIMAVVVALFLNEIRSLFKKVRYEITLVSPEIKEKASDVNGTLCSELYYNSIQFYNNGNISAQNCELYIEDAVCDTDGVRTPLSYPNLPVKWGSDNGMMYIPNNGKRILDVFKMTAPQGQSTPDGKGYSKESEYIIAGLPSPQAKKGKYIITYCLYSSTAKPVRFKLSIDWDGKWEKRQSEMKNRLKLKLDLV